MPFVSWLSEIRPRVAIVWISTGDVLRCAETLQPVGVQLLGFGVPRSWQFATPRPPVGPWPKIPVGALSRPRSLISTRITARAAGDSRRLRVAARASGNPWGPVNTGGVTFSRSL